jgi:hypothetical protein
MWVVKPVTFLFTTKKGQAELNYFVAPSAVKRKNGDDYEEVRTKVFVKAM